MTKMKLQGTTMKKLQVNINGIKNGKNKDYLGFMIFPKSVSEKTSLQRSWTTPFNLISWTSSTTKTTLLDTMIAKLVSNTIQLNNHSPFNGHTRPKPMLKQLLVTQQRISPTFWFLELIKLTLEIRV